MAKWRRIRLRFAPLGQRTARDFCCKGTKLFVKMQVFGLFFWKEI